MNARAEPLTERDVVDHFVFASSHESNARWLADTLAAAGRLEQVSLEPAALLPRIAALHPSLVFVDFSGSDVDAAASAVQAVRAHSPQLQIVAVGTVAEPEGAIAALRAGVRDFIDVRAGPEEAVRIARHVLENVTEPQARHGRLTMLLGARVGVGVSTLAANLAALLQRQGAAAGKHAAIVDLGLPAGDSMLYLNTRSEFDFVEAVRNLRRFDKTFVHTALTRHASGLALTTLPPDLSMLRTVSFSSAVALLNRLRAFFDRQIVDLGGFSNNDFIAQVARAADDIWLVCDSSIASVVSAIDLLRELADAQVDTSRFGLVVNRFDPRLGLAADQIASRLDLPLVATLPSRQVPLGRAANQGKLIVDAAERDPYVRAIAALAQRLSTRTNEGGADPGGEHEGRRVSDSDSAIVARRQAAASLARIKRFLHLPQKRS
ncbi:fimbrial protein [Trinickia symbiotica]|uniref:Fimbrial protein n=1 Tax=Trinickia symbiotica TaxID=863227 RepID=A0A2T3XZL6_9BURK|nr:fimbrial protein [Trinickia symbiotica]PTB21959.1 fimbrial protein [Trinickia symbiotica]